ncbi:pinopsin-like [Lethenteron reissneri]|uniref:pinopsin-like n=1 Tax=Lethenteron reissneri TaxID=7753 RepID=UPI002AB6E4B0|nr:pinopsin-like [Lethenteron reissneri]XP_061430089.1 pinopsin-like [Lethenteron reissneri]XP_061430090.1 pinopsin-like [Lethenteron reissneri]
MQEQSSSTAVAVPGAVTPGPTIFPPAGYSFLAAIMFLDASLSIVNNTLVIVITCRYPSLRSPLNALILSMCVSDLLMSLCGTTIAMVSNFHGSLRHIGHAGCVFQGFSVNYFGCVSLWSLTLLAYERRLVVTHGCSMRGGWPRARRGLAFVWTFCLVWAVAPLLGWSAYGPEGVQTSCSIAWERRSLSNYTYLVSYFLACFVIPVSIIVFSYGNVLCSLHTLNKKIKRVGGHPDPREEMRAAVMVLAMVGAFMACWLPYTVLALCVVLSPGTQIPPLVATLPMYFAKTSPIYNPIIYFFLNRQFRACAVEFVTCGAVKLNEPKDESAAPPPPADTAEPPGPTPPRHNQVSPA